MRIAAWRLWSGWFLGLFLAAPALLADEAVVTHNVNLRQGPSISQPLIRLLKPPDRLTLLDPQATNDYLHVRTDGNEEGWVWNHNVHIVPAGTALGAGAAASISGAWDKPEPQTGTFTSEGKTCGPTGQDEDTGTNRRKNRTDMPASYHDVTFDAVATLDYPKDATTSRDGWTPEQLDAIKPFEGVALRTVGYVVAIKPQTGGSGESTNCHMTKAAQTDWHVALVKDAGKGGRKGTWYLRLVRPADGADKEAANADEVGPVVDACDTDALKSGKSAGFSEVKERQNDTGGLYGPSLPTELPTPPPTSSRLGFGLPEPPRRERKGIQTFRGKRGPFRKPTVKISKKAVQLGS